MRSSVGGAASQESLGRHSKSCALSKAVQYGIRYEITRSSRSIPLISMLASFLCRNQTPDFPNLARSSLGATLVRTSDSLQARENFCSEAAAKVLDDYEWQTILQQVHLAHFCWSRGDLSLCQSNVYKVSHCVHFQ